MVNSKAKGGKREREVAKILRDAGFEARRGQQFCGSPDSPDVIATLPLPLHLEVKGVEKLNVEAAMLQSEREAGVWEIPVVIHRRNKTRWLFTMRLDAMLEVLKCIKT